MMAFCYGGKPEREQFVCQIVASMSQKTPEAARRQIMIGKKAECLDTIERYTNAGVTHFIFMTFAPHFPDELQAFAEDVIPAVREAVAAE